MYARTFEEILFLEGTCNIEINTRFTYLWPVGRWDASGKLPEGQTLRTFSVPGGWGGDVMVFDFCRHRRYGIAPLRLEIDKRSGIQRYL